MSDNKLFSLWDPSWVLWENTKNNIEKYGIGEGNYSKKKGGG